LLVLSTSNCRTRTIEEISASSSERVVFTPFVREGSSISNTFYAAAEFAGILGDKHSLSNVAPCVVTASEHGETTFIAATGGISKSILPISSTCTDSNGVGIKTLRDVSGEIFIVAHAHAVLPRLEIGFGNGGTEDRQQISPDELAELLLDNGLACDHKQITLIVLSGAQALSSPAVNKRYIELYREMQLATDEDEKITLRNEWAMLALRARDPQIYDSNINLEAQTIPFAAMLAIALNQRGYADVQVTGFNGPVRSRIGNEPTNSGLYEGLQIEINSKRLAHDVCAKKSKKARKISDCVDRLLSICDDCMLESDGSKSYSERLSDCRNQLRESGSKNNIAASGICGTKLEYVTSKWIYTIKGSEARESTK